MTQGEKTDVQYVCAVLCDETTDAALAKIRAQLDESIERFHPSNGESHITLATNPDGFSEGQLHALAATWKAHQFEPDMEAPLQLIYMGRLGEIALVLKADSEPLQEMRQALGNNWQGFMSHITLGTVEPEALGSQRRTRRYLWIC